MIWLLPQFLAFSCTTLLTFLSMLPPFRPFFKMYHSRSYHRAFSHAIPSVWITLLLLYYLAGRVLSSHSTSLSITSSGHHFLTSLACLLPGTYHYYNFFICFVIIGECLASFLGSSYTRSWFMYIFTNHCDSSLKQENNRSSIDIYEMKNHSYGCIIHFSM